MGRYGLLWTACLICQLSNYRQECCHFLLSYLLSTTTSQQTKFDTCCTLSAAATRPGTQYGHVSSQTNRTASMRQQSISRSGCVSVSAVAEIQLSPHCPALYAIKVGCMCSGAVKPRRFKIVGPTLASPGSFTLGLNFVPSGKPGPPMMTGTCMHGTQVSFSQTQFERHHCLDQMPSLPALDPPALRHAKLHRPCKGPIVQSRFAPVRACAR